MEKSMDVQKVVAIQDKSVAILANETAIPMIIADMGATTSTKMLVVKKENERWFNQVYREVQNKFFPDDQVSYIQAIASRNSFTTQQSIQLLRLFDWDEEKLKVLSYVAPRLRDPRNAYRLIDQFTFSDSQQKARQLLGLPD